MQINYLVGWQCSYSHNPPSPRPQVKIAEGIDKYLCADHTYTNMPIYTHIHIYMWKLQRLSLC